MNNRLKYQMRLVRRSLRRAAQRSRYGTALERAPVLFANSFPKSGTHLLTQILMAFPQIGPAVDSGLPAVVTFDGNNGLPRNVSAIIEDLRRLKPGDIAYGHLHAIPEVVRQLTAPGNAAYFILRDPRDVVVSHVHYITEMEPNHIHHTYYTRELRTFDERLRTSILGIPDDKIPFPAIGERFAPYIDWLTRREVLTLHYEDLIHHPQEKLAEIINHAVSRGFELGIPPAQAVEILKTAINPQKSPTFRTGKTGGWVTKFNAANRQLFKEAAGDLLITLGYEQNNDW